MNILAIGSHPDDIEFGCGGSLLKYSRNGHSVFLLILTDGSFGGNPKIRIKEQEAAAKFIKTKNIFWGGFKDTELVGSRELILKIERVVQRVSPDIVFLNYWDDVHQDHRAAASAGVSATRYIKEVLFYEVPTTQNFTADIFVDITSVLKSKLKLLSIHRSQVSKTGVEKLSILESAISCANYRGFQARVKYAEGFKASRFLMDIA
ncbi:MAG: PIG-L family deacetylase [Candidatus Omnitrophica bacterium]|nr:PIG-L family deacetylase [Candidatus Omnitrophota bacterium]